MKNKTVLIVSHREEVPRLLVNELSPIFQNEYNNRYALKFTSNEQEYNNDAQGIEVVLIIIDYYKNSFPDREFIKNRLLSAKSFGLILIDIEKEFEFDRTLREEDFDAYHPGLIATHKIERSIRVVLDMDNEKSLNVFDAHYHEAKDNISAVLKGIIGMAPAGSILAEIVGIVIPNQRLSRFERLLRVLIAKIASLEEDKVREKVKSPYFIDLLEEGSLQAVRAISEERIEYIASILKNGISAEESDLIGYKAMLLILGQLNDIEIITLKYYGLYTSQGLQQEYWRKHSEVLMSPTPHMGSDQDEVDKNTIHQTYKDTLVRTKLLRQTFKKPKKGQLPEFDERTGMIATSGYSITPLGKLLLRHIDLENNEDAFIQEETG